MIEYSLYTEGRDGVCMGLEAESNEVAITLAKRLAVVEYGKVFRLYMIERDEYPELHNAIDATGPLHKVFVHKFTFEEDGTVLDDETVWDENVDISFTEN